jgi:hypothetical protein
MMRRTLTAALAFFGSAAMGTAAHAEFGSDTSWWKTFAISGYGEVGAMGSLDSATGGRNFGRLFDDRPNRAELNQFAVTATRPLDPNADNFDYGFTFQPMFGSDARFTHLLGVGAHADRNLHQFTIIEADGLMHLPWTVKGGTDVKLGLFPSPMSAETTVPSTNLFFSHSYIFNFGVTFAHLGALTVSHVDPLLDVYLGVDAGNQTTPWTDNNHSAAGFAGLGVNLMGGNLVITWLNHLGPENPTGALSPGGSLVDGSMRWYSDATMVYKYNDKLTLTTDVNFIRDAGFNANGYGAAQYVSYVLDNTFTLNARAEVWRDDRSFFVAAFPGNADFVNVLTGQPSTAISLFPHSATYSELTAGVTVKTHLPDPLGDLLFRPEVRWDHSTANAFDNATGHNSFTVGADVIISF